MAQIRPFAAIRYAKRADLDLSRLLAPPYDVLDEKQKAELQSHHPNNVVSVDLPHLPPKEAGPAEVYAKANTTLQAWLSAGVLVKDPRPALYPYAQSYQHGGRTFHRRGFIAAVKLAPFGAGQVVPHEKTYKGPIQDRLHLMKATGVQLSPVFGLFSDPDNKVTNLLYKSASAPMLSGTLDGVKNDLWAVHQAEIETQVIDLMRDRPIYIADGHHRYTTALQYQQDLAQQHGGTLPPKHPANYCMFILVAMQDPGLLILPTHRLIGGLNNFTIDAFKTALGDTAELVPTRHGPAGLPQLVGDLAATAGQTFGVYDAVTRTSYLLRIKKPDVLKTLEPGQSPAWRSLDVAVLQRYLLDEVIKPNFASGQQPALAYTADPAAVLPLMEKSGSQVALLLRPTPLRALEELGRHGEVMPQKSTYFFPKLATGMAMYSLT